jgi:pheromone shutdown-related protein TraB
VSEIAAQPLRRIERDGTEFVLLGTAHVSRASADAVRDMLAQERFDAVAVELCAHRADAMRNPDAVHAMDLMRVLREGRAGVVAAGLALAAYQRRLAEQFGIEPGAEMRAGMDGAEAQQIPCWLIDRDVGLTLRRTRAAVGWWERAKITAGLMSSVLDDSEVGAEDIERLKQGDMLESTFTEFAQRSPPLYHALIAERDAYMAARLRQQAAQDTTRPKRVLAVVGAGHLQGMVEQLTSRTEDPEVVLAPLRAEPPKSPWGKRIGYALIALVLLGFVWAFVRGVEVGRDVVLMWVITTGVPGAIGAALGGGHPLSVLAGFAASPITVLHPALSSGMASGAVESWIRKPKVSDFARLRDDLVHASGWWRNPVSRVFLVFFLTNLGTMIGFWMAGTRLAVMLAQ